MVLVVVVLNISSHILAITKTIITILTNIVILIRIIPSLLFLMVRTRRGTVYLPRAQFAKRHDYKQYSMATKLFGESTMWRDHKWATGSN